LRFDVDLPKRWTKHSSEAPATPGSFVYSPAPAPPKAKPGNMNIGAEDAIAKLQDVSY
jgi:hypothetical protein